MDLIICSTPYQVMTSVLLKANGFLSETTDLIIFSYFKGAESIKENIDKEFLFRNTKLSDVMKYLKRCQEGRYTRYLWNGYCYLTCKQFAKKYGYLRQYDRIFYSFVDPSVVILSKYYIRLNPEVQFIGFEDGLSDYYNNQRGEHFNRPRWAKWFGIPERVFKRKAIYYYTPDLAPDSNGEYEKLKINIDWKNHNAISMLNRIFSFPEEGEIHEKAIYFDQLPHPRVGISDDFNLRTIKAIKEHFDNNYLVKLAPRRTTNIYDGYNCFPYQSIPFEICCMNSDYTDKIFVTNISSACFMPKMLFGYEPTLVFLFNIVHQEIDASISDFLERFISTYSDKDKIMFPRDEIELSNVIKKLSKMSF